MPFKSRHPDIEIPDVDIWTFIFERSQRPFRTSKTILHDTTTPRAYTFGQIRSSAIGFGQALHTAWDWQKGDVLMVFSQNDVDWAAVVFGTLWAGGVVTTANPGHGVEGLSSQLRDSGAKVIVTQAEHLKTALAAASQAGIPEERVVLMGSNETISPQARHFTSLPGYRIPGSNEPTPRPFLVDPDRDLSFIVYSSGTTGKPKGVMISHRNIVSAFLMLSKSFEGFITCGNGTTGSGDRTVGFLPFFHIYGLTGTLIFALYGGTEVFVMPSFSFVPFLELVQKHKITFNNVVPRMILLLAKDPTVSNYDLSSLRLLTSAAAPLTKELVDMLYSRLKVPVRQSYGLSEGSPSALQQDWDEWDEGIGTIGRPAPNIEAKVMDVEAIPGVSEKELSTDEAGEIWIRGANVFKGYLNNIEATKQTITPDGWLRTGDVGYVDKRGLFWLTDRIKELIKYNGFQVAPAELEGLLTSHPKVKDAAVVGVWSREGATELPRGYVVLDDGVQRSEQVAKDIVLWMEQRVAKHKRLRGGVRLVATIPYSATGKILRRELKALAEKEGEEKAKL